MTIPLTELKPTAFAEVSVHEPSPKTYKLVKAHQMKPEPDVKDSGPETEEGNTFTIILPTRYVAW